MYATSLPQVGNLKFEVVVDAGAKGKGEFIVYYSLGLTRFKLYRDCVVRLDLNLGFPLFFRPLDTSFHARFPMPIPANVPPAWIGTSLYFQAAGRNDPGGKLFGGGSVSTAMRILLGK